jgi:hypothetical protein
MGNRTPICMALAGSCALAAAVYALFGWNVAGAHAAARYTARFSLIWFTVGFAAPGLRRIVRSLPDETRLVQSFFAAHLVHFATVGLLLAMFERGRVVQNPIAVGATVLIGASAVIATGLTAMPRASRLYVGIHGVALYTVFLIFFIAYARHPIKPMRLLAVALGIALLLRLTSHLTLYSARAGTAS